MDYKFVAGDTGSILRVTCKNDSDDAVIDITGATMKLKWKNKSGILQTKTMTPINPPTNGKAEYQFATGELFPGLMEFEIEITDAASKIVRSVDLISLSVRRALS